MRQPSSYKIYREWTRIHTNANEETFVPPSLLHRKITKITKTLRDVKGFTRGWN
jgi:hypothetical protein